MREHFHIEHIIIFDEVGNVMVKDGLNPMIMSEQEHSPSE